MLSAPRCAAQREEVVVRTAWSERPPSTPLDLARLAKLAKPTDREAQRRQALEPQLRRERALCKTAVEPDAERLKTLAAPVRPVKKLDALMAAATQQHRAARRRPQSAGVASRRQQRRATAEVALSAHRQIASILEAKAAA
eukprot:SAG11_NODE_12407_length_705_cov_1.120462_1_plen_140_part_10